MVKITINDDNGEIVLGSSTTDSESMISALEIMLDTIDDNAKRRGEGILARVNFSGEVKEASDNDAHINLIKLFKWSQGAKDEEEYRTVKVEIFEKNELQRKYEFPKMFVCDYKEEYDGKDKGVKFDIKLNQRDGQVVNIKTEL